MQKITFLVLVSLAFVLTACFRSAGSDTPTAQPVGLDSNGPTEVADSSTATDAPTQETLPTDAPTQETLPTNTPTQEVAVQASPSETDIPPSSTPVVPTVTATLPIVEQGGDTSGEAIPLGEGPTASVNASPATQFVIQPTDTPSATASNTATATHTVTPTATATASATASATATATQTNTSAGPSPTLTTVALQGGIQNTSNGNSNPPPAIGQGGQLGPTATTIGLQGQQPEVAQVVSITPTVDTFGVPTVEQPAQPNTINQMTATAVIQNATQTQAAVETIAAGGDPNAVPQQQVTPGGAPIVITATPIGQVAPDCEYQVQIGDNLGTIANTYNTTINDLAIRNSITNPDLIRAGYPIIIPGCGQGTATTTIITPTATLPGVDAGGGVVATNNANGPFTYTVLAGDNIYRLSVNYGVTMREILAANPQVSNMNIITEGQQLTIPGPPTQTTTTTIVTPTAVPNVIIVTPSFTPPGIVAPTVQQPQVVQPTVAQPIVPAFTPSFTPAGAQG